MSKRMRPRTGRSNSSAPPRDSTPGPEAEEPEEMEVNDPDNNNDEPVLGLPAQDLRERRQIRNDLRDVQISLDENQHEYQDPRSTGLHDTLHKLEGIFDKVKHTREASLDSAILYKIAESGKRQAQALHTDFIQFEPKDFADRLLLFLEQQNRDEEDTVTHLSQEAWEKLGDAVQTFFQRSPPLHFMYGSFERGPPKRKERKVRTPKDKEDIESQKASQPRTIVPSTTRKTETTTEEVDLVHKILKREYRYWDNQPMCYFTFVINPESFAQTIENIFHVSFLVKDGLARISLDEDKLPVIAPVSKREGQDEQNNGPRHQVVMTLTMKDWLELKEMFPVERPVIPTRKHVSREEDRDSDSENTESTNRAVAKPAKSGRGGKK